MPVNRPFMIRFLIHFLIFTTPAWCLAQERVFIAADSIVQVEENGEVSNWFLDFTLNPDVYSTNALGQKVIFHSGGNQLEIEIDKGTDFDFVIVYAGDSAFTKVKYEMSRLDLLKASGEYGNDFNDGLVFMYQDENVDELVSLREKYNLDSIAGGGSDVSKVVNLMHWVHESIEHNGNKPNPSVKNAQSMIEKCSNKEGSLNCRGLGIVLNEIYLSMGFKSRYVTCKPKELEFNDCHVINTVFVPSLNKWIWMDPTWDAYVKDEKGNFLSIEEVREKIISGDALFVNENANWNNRSFIDANHYLYEYMAKNLYRIECPIRSEFDLESPKRGKKNIYFELVPKNDFQELPYSEEHKSRKTGVKNVLFRTSNPDLFWARPE